MPWDQGPPSNKSAIIASSAPCGRPCSAEEGDPRRLILGLLPGLRSCLLILQIPGHSPCFLSSLKYMSGKSRHPHRPCCVWKW